jgi:hypothetical protein
MEGFSSSSKGKQEQEKGGELERRSKMKREKNETWELLWRENDIPLLTNQQVNRLERRNNKWTLFFFLLGGRKQEIQNNIPHQ